MRIVYLEDVKNTRDILLHKTALDILAIHESKRFQVDFNVINVSDFNQIWVQALLLLLLLLLQLGGPAAIRKLCCKESAVCD